MEPYQLQRSADILSAFKDLQTPSKINCRDANGELLQLFGQDQTELEYKQEKPVEKSKSRKKSTGWLYKVELSLALNVMTPLERLFAICIHSLLALLSILAIRNIILRFTA